MPIRLNQAQLSIKDENGRYIGINTIAEKLTTQQITDIQNTANAKKVEMQAIKDAMQTSAQGYVNLMYSGSQPGFPQYYATVQELDEHIIEISSEQPTSQANKLWINNGDVEEVQLSTIEDLNNIIAPAYSDSETYNVGDYCIKDGYMYRCNTAISTAEVWTAAHWTQATTGSEVSDLKSAVNTLDEFAGAIAPNLLPNNLTNTTANGITYTVNSDGTVTVNGTATATGQLAMSVSLPAGKYRISGAPNPAVTNCVLRTIVGSSVRDLTDDYIMTLSSATTLNVYVRVVSGAVCNNVVFKPMVSSPSYTGEYVQYGKSIVPQTAQEMVDDAVKDVDDITGYKKPNLFNNTIQSQTANGLTFTVNGDKSVTIVGTATALSAPNAKCTLPTGKYVVNGCNDGSSQSYHIMVIRGDGSYFLQFGGRDVGFEVTDEIETITLYVRVTKNAVVDTTMYPMIRPASVYNPTYAPYGDIQVYKPIQQLIDYTAFNWSGKKMNVIGDSIVQGSYGNFIVPIRDILCLSEARNYGVGGSCLASSSADADYPPAVLRYTNMDTDAQIIIVHAGTNDYSAQIPLGADDSTDITTFNGALNVMMSGLRDMYPTALIIFDSILHRFNDGALTIKASEYRECIENRCLANHIVFYDSYRYTGFDFVKGYYDHILTSDGLHPNQVGANILGRKLAGFIRWN